MSTISQATTTGDLVVYTSCSRYTVTAGPDMIVTGWRGGLLVQWCPLVGKSSVMMVRPSDGNAVVGIMVEPSEDYAPGATWASTINFTSRQLKATSNGWPPGAPNTTAIVTGNFVCKLRVFETVALTGGGTRTGGAITYNTMDRLYVSENGYVCNDDPANLTAAGITSVTFIGYVVNPPSEINDFGLECDLRLA